MFHLSYANDFILCERQEDYHQNLKQKSKLMNCDTVYLCQRLKIGQTRTLESGNLREINCFCVNR